MVCKKDVLQWFKELESYKRIDTMCSLLIVCLPFELRFLGTCLEELGRRDSLELRGMELRANNPQDLAADILTCQKGEPTDIKIRRKMALYLALIRACNRTCVTEIFRTLKCWGERDFTSMNDQDTLLELLLVYTMAANHPVFSFHQQMQCTDILAKIKENKLVADDLVLQQQMEHQQQHPHPPSQQDLLLQQQHCTAMHQIQAAPQQQQQHPQMLQILPQGSIPMIFPQHLPKLLPSSDGTHEISVDGIPHMIQSNITIPGDSSAMIAHPNTAAAAWSMRHFVQPSQPGIDHQVPPQASSPMLSQQSSPSSSRTTSPNRGNSALLQQQLPQQLRSLPQRLTGGMKNVRRPSAETTPPPMGSGELPMQTHHVKNMDDSNDGVGSSGATSLPTLIRNGYPRAVQHHRLKSGGYMSYQQQQQQQSPVGQPPQHFQTSNYINASGVIYTMENMNMNDDSHMSTAGTSGSMMSINSNKSTATTGSDSGSSNGSSGEISPSPTPLHSTANSVMGMGPAAVVCAQMAGFQQQPKHHLSYKQQQQLNLQQRLNGRNGVEKSYQQITYTTSTPNLVSDSQTNSSGNTQQQALLISPSPTSTPTTTVPVLLQQQQQPPPPTAYSAATYPYHAASGRGPPPQTLIQPHNAPPQHGGFRFPMHPPHNGEIIYSAYPTGLAYLSVSPATAPAAAPTIVTAPPLRNAAAVVSANAAVQTTAPQQQPPLQVCPITGSGATQKIISCYNCGSQSHNGRDCQEVSMEDVTRSATYKLDYSVSAVAASSATNTSMSTGGEHKEAGSSLATTATPAPASAGTAVMSSSK